MLVWALKIIVKCWHSWAPSIPISRSFHGLKIYYDLRDNPAYIATSKSKREEAPEFRALDEDCQLTGGMRRGCWDVGSNVGIVSLYAASLGYEVVAFDISQKALRYLKYSAHANGFHIRAVEAAFSIRSFHYLAPKSASSENRVQADALGIGAKSVTYMEAADTFGIPQFIKMDIEGGEIDFIESKEFREWIVKHKITWLVELHNLSYVDILKKLWKYSQVRIIYGNNSELYPMVLIR
jgi:FkbM family methyltransferase